MPGVLASAGLVTCRRDGVEGGGRGSSRDLGSQVEALREVSEEGRAGKRVCVCVA